MDTVSVLSLGAGVQSSATLLMSDRGMIERADFAVFADTQAEPTSVYDWLDYLETQVSIPIIRVTQGSIEQDVLSGGRAASVPFYVRSGDGSEGIARRQCTSEYKLKPIFKAVRERLGYKPKQRVKHHVRMIMGISCDEVYRVKTSQIPWITNVYPLIDLWKHRQWCVEYVQNVLGRMPPRSACYMCPYHSDSEWRRLKIEEPVFFQKAIEFDSAIRKRPKMDGENYLHRSLMPLSDVDLSDPNADQLDMFNSDCEGMCGV